MPIINEIHINKPEMLELARGVDFGSSTAAIYSVDGTPLVRITNGGIRAPMRTMLNAGVRLVRLGSGGLPRRVAQGYWWLEWGQYKLVESFADRNRMAMPVAMRLFCCVPLEWNDMTVVVQARLKVPMLAYVGKSAPVFQKHRQTASVEFIDGQPHGHDPIDQLFIPGLNEPDMVHDALMIEGTGYIPQSQSRDGFIIRVL